MSMSSRSASGDDLDVEQLAITPPPASLISEADLADHAGDKRVPVHCRSLP
jgi:hypothetical protein